MITEKLFCIKDDEHSYKKYKVVTVFGIKMSFCMGWRFIPRPLVNNNDDNLLIKNSMPQVYLSIAAIMKNEGSYLKEWIEYHRLVGVERFYLYDNESSDNTKEILKPYIEEGIVIYRYVEGSCMQFPAYLDAIYKYKNQTRWLAVIDLDEYIVPVEKDSVKEFLKDYEKYPAVGVNWVMFDSNGHVKKPETGVLESYTRCGGGEVTL
ncbi:MAG: glycosyltransferase family 92 protein [Candidatus Gastranaerophilales bacterium]|nr:glycosyltransferase family 92 protein [Candidatus Gastranaerophilales bacterium]